MTIEFVSGDLLNPMKEDAIAHGCNCIGTMGAGIAKEIQSKWPFAMIKAYKRLCSEGWEHSFGIPNDPLEPGQVQYLKFKGFPLLINLFTQRGIWTQKDGSPPAKLKWIETCLLNMVSELSLVGEIKTVGIPRIGAGLGGLNWEDVKALMIEILGPVENIHFVVYEHYVPGVKNEMPKMLEESKQS